MNARADFKAAWGKYRADQYASGVPAYIDQLAQADWDDLATRYSGTVLTAAQRCAQRDANPGTEVKEDGSIGPCGPCSRRIALRNVRERSQRAPAGVQCQYFDTGIPD